MLNLFAPFADRDDSVAEIAKEEIADLLDAEDLNGPVPNGSLLAARWLLGIRRYDVADAQRDVRPGTLTLKLRELAEGEYYRSTVRREIAFSCLMWEEDWGNETPTSRSALFKVNSPRTKDVAIALAEAIKVRVDRLHADPSFLADRKTVWDTMFRSARVPSSEVPEDSGSPVEVFPDGSAKAADLRNAESEDAEPSLPVRRGAKVRGKRTLAVTALTAIAGVIAWALVSSPWAQAQAADEISIQNVTTKPGFIAQRYWVPASASLDTLPSVERYCRDSNGDTPLARWLSTNGVAEDLPRQFVVRNLSHSEDLVTLSEVTLHSTAPPRNTPGFFVYCPSGGGMGSGGDISWSYLTVKVADGQQAGVSTKEPSTYFSRTVGKGMSAGLILRLNGDQTFNGVVTVKVEQLDHATSIVNLPIAPGGSGETLEWHSVPKDKYLEVSPRTTGASGFNCKYSSDDRAKPRPCTLMDIKQTLRSYWRSDAVR